MVAAACTEPRASRSQAYVKTASFVLAQRRFAALPLG